LINSQIFDNLQAIKTNILFKFTHTSQFQRLYVKIYSSPLTAKKNLNFKRHAWKSQKHITMRKFNEFTDTELVISFQEGNSPALEALISRYKDKLFSSILFIVKDKFLAEDLFQNLCAYH